MQAHSKLAVDVTLAGPTCGAFSRRLVAEWEVLIHSHGALNSRLEQLLATAAQMHSDLLDLVDAVRPLLDCSADPDHWDRLELLADQLNTTYRKDH
jgi:hypothetical protein